MANPGCSFVVVLAALMASFAPGLADARDRVIVEDTRIEAPNAFGNLLVWTTSTPIEVNPQLFKLRMRSGGSGERRSGHPVPAASSTPILDLTVGAEPHSCTSAVTACNRACVRSPGTTSPRIPSRRSNRRAPTAGSSAPLFGKTASSTSASAIVTRPDAARTKACTNGAVQRDGGSEIRLERRQIFEARGCCRTTHVTTFRFPSEEAPEKRSFSETWLPAAPPSPFSRHPSCRRLRHLG